MNDRPQIDPRYDPAFQRGFTGEVQTGQHPHGAVRSARQPTTPAPEAPSSPRRAEPLPSSSLPPAYAVAAAQDQTDAEPDEVAAAGDAVDDEIAPARPLTRNPFVIVLALLGAVLVVAGASWAIAGRATMTDSGALASERDYWYVQAALMGAPVTIAAGVLVLAGVLFMFANAWNRAR